MRWRI